MGHPLADYCQMIAPTICAGCRNWHDEDGDELTTADAVALADALQAEIDAGRAESYARQYAADHPPLAEPLELVLPNGDSPFSTENVADFVAFLRESGGFEIW